MFPEMLYRGMSPLDLLDAQVINTSFWISPAAQRKTGLISTLISYTAGDSQPKTRDVSVCPGGGFSPESVRFKMLHVFSPQFIHRIFTPCSDRILKDVDVQMHYSREWYGTETLFLVSGNDCKQTKLALFSSV